MGYVYHILILLNVYIILSVATGLIVGLSKMISLGQAAFFGVGAYITALCVIVLDLSLIPSLLLVILINALISLIIAIPSIRLKGDYFILATLAFQFIVFALLNNLDGITNGSLGIGDIRPVSVMDLFNIEGQSGFFLLSIVLAFIVVLVFYLIYHAPFGTALKALSEDELVLQSMGKDSRKLKIYAFVIASSAIGLASYVFATYMTYIFPGGFHLEESIFILIAVLLGGSGSIRGAIAGAIFVVMLPELLRFAGIPEDVAAPVRQIIFGLALVLLMRFRSGGLLGVVKL